MTRLVIQICEQRKDDGRSMWPVWTTKYVQPAVSPGLPADPALPGALALPPALVLISVLALLS